jgi:hypothetical protein
MDTRGITRRSLAALVAVPFGFLVLPTFGADIAPNMNCGPRLAIDGYDIVAYYIEGRSIPGKLEYQTVWHHVRWQFASKDNLDLFAKNPAEYAEHYDEPIDAR